MTIKEGDGSVSDLSNQDDLASIGNRVKVVKRSGGESVDSGDMIPDGESEGSSAAEEVESLSPRSVTKWRMRPRKETRVHSQVLRVREEDSYLGEDIVVTVDELTLNRSKDVVHTRASTSSSIIVSHVSIQLPCSRLSRTMTPIKTLAV